MEAPLWVRNRFPQYADPDAKIAFRKPAKQGDGELIWESNPGPQTWMQICPANEVVVGGSRGGGKLSPLDSLVCTPFGFVRMGDVKVGDQVTDPTTGGVSRVVAVHPHPPMPIWKLTFDDGAALEVGADHLWSFKTANHIRPGTKKSSERAYSTKVFGTVYDSTRWNTCRVGTTSELVKLFEDKDHAVRIPLTNPIAFTIGGAEHAIDPYLLGVFLGDGDLYEARITSADEETADYLKTCGFSESGKIDNAAKCYRAYGEYRKKYRQYFANHDLLKCHSDDKFIPFKMKHGNLETRLAILQGLMDTDGTVDERGRCYFASASIRLAEDVQFIARSLGAKARIRVREDVFACLPNGEKKRGLPSYVVRIWHPKTSCLFRLTRKKTRCTDSWNGGHELMRELVGVEYIGEKEAQCITVSSPYGLYLGNDFVVTHNSAGLIAWFAQGDASLAEDDPAKHSFLNDPSFVGLMLRKEYQALREFVEKATEFFRPFGLFPKDDPVVFESKHGAKIYTNHLGSEDAYEKYRGMSITKIGIEELVQIPDIRHYIKLLGSLRSVERVYKGKRYPALRTQIMSTTNPDGPGAPFVKERFIDIFAGGKPVPPNTIVQDPVTELTRCYIPMKLNENPYLANNVVYKGMLLAQDAVTRAQWIDGDWNAGTGVFFREYRPDGPRGADEIQKYPWASHVIRDAIELKPWWYRWGSGDIGYDHPAAFHKFCLDQSDQRIKVYDELQVRQVGAYELGAMVAQWWHPELEQLPDHQITLFFSPDAFNKTDATKTRAEQFEEGIKAVLGPAGAFLVGYNEDEKKAMVRNKDYAEAMFQRRKQEIVGSACIVIKRANNDRVGGASYIRDLLRWRPLLETAITNKDLREVYEKRGREAYESLVSTLRTEQPMREVLPKLQLAVKCTHLNRWLKTAQHDDLKREDIAKMNAVEGKGGDDAGESFRMGCQGYKDIKAVIPKSYWVADRMKEAAQHFEQVIGVPLTDPTRLAQIERTQAALYEKKHGASAIPAGMTMPRSSSQRHRTN